MVTTPARKLNLYDNCFLMCSLPAELQKLILLHIADIHTWICASEVCGFWHGVVQEYMHSRLLQFTRWHSNLGCFYLPNGVAHGITNETECMLFNPEISQLFSATYEQVYMYGKHILTLYKKYSEGKVMRELPSCLPQIIYYWHSSNTPYKIKWHNTGTQGTHMSASASALSMIEYTTGEFCSIIRIKFTNNNMIESIVVYSNVRCSGRIDLNQFTYRTK